MFTLDQQRTTSTAGAARIRTRRWLTVLAAVAVAAAIWAGAALVLNIELAARPGVGAVQPIGIPAVIVISLLAGLSGWLLLALLETDDQGRADLAGGRRPCAGGIPRRPLSAVNLAATVVLLCLHVVVGVILIWGLPRRPET